MLQLEVVQNFANAVTSIPPIDALVFDTLDGDMTRIREIAIQKVGLHSGSPNVRAFTTSSESAMAQVFLVSARGENPLVVFYGPSHVDSPPVVGPEMVMLLVRDLGFGVASGGELNFSRAIDAHVYLEESPALPTQPVSRNPSFRQP